jgi:hypothetical protein
MKSERVEASRKKRLLASIPILIIIVIGFFVTFSALSPPSKAVSTPPTINSAIKVATNGYAEGNAELGLNGIFGGYNNVCWDGQDWIVAYPTSTSNQVGFAYSQDGNTWNTGILYTTSHTLSDWNIACSLTGKIIFAYGTTTTSPYIFYNIISLTNPSSPSNQYGSDTAVIDVSNACNPTTSYSGNLYVTVDSSGNFYIVTSGYESGSAQYYFMYLNGNCYGNYGVANKSLFQPFAFNGIVTLYGQSTTANPNIYVAGCLYSGVSGNCSPQGNGIQLSTSSCTLVNYGSPTIVSSSLSSSIYSAFIENCSNGNPVNCYIVEFDAYTQSFTTITPTGSQITNCGYQYSSSSVSTTSFLAQDIQGDTFWGFGDNGYPGQNIAPTTFTFLYSSNSGLTFTGSAFSEVSGEIPIAYGNQILNPNPNTGQQQDVIELMDYSGNVYVQVVGGAFSSSSACSGLNCTQTGGSGGVTSTGYTARPNFVYLYQGTTLSTSGIIIQSITTSIDAVTGVRASQGGSQLTLAIWWGTTTNPPSLSYPLAIGYSCSQTFTLSNSTTGTITFNSACSIPTNVRYAVGMFYSSQGDSPHPNVEFFEPISEAMYNDTVDASTSLVNSKAVASAPSITTVFTATQALFLQYVYTIPQVSVVATSTLTLGTTTIYSTVTTTSIPTTALVGQLVGYLPVWIFPLLLGGWFGIIGLFMGLIIGLGFGTLFGLVPLWMAFLLGLGILYMMSRLH